MLLSELQYMALSQLIYSPKLPTTKKPGSNEFFTVKNIVDGKLVKDPQDPAFSSLSSLYNYTLLSYQSLSSGLAAAASQSPNNPKGTSIAIVNSRSLSYIENNK